MGKLGILYVEGDEEVLTNQAKEIEKGGYQVTQSCGRKAAEAALKQAQFDMVVLGQTLSRDDRHHLPYMAKKSREATKVLVAHTDGSRHPYADGNTDTGSDLKTLIEKINEMSESKSMAKSAGR